MHVWLLCPGLCTCRACARAESCALSCNNMYQACIRIRCNRESEYPRYVCAAILGSRFCLSVRFQICEECYWSLSREERSSFFIILFYWTNDVDAQSGQSARFRNSTCPNRVKAIEKSKLHLKKIFKVRLLEFFTKWFVIKKKH